MSSFERRKPPGAEPARELTTTEGVKVVVKDVRRPEPEDEPAPRERSPRAIVVPLGQPEKDREAMMRWLEKEHGAFIHQRLRREVQPASARDLGQSVLLVLCKRIEEGRPPENVRAFLEVTLQYHLSNHRQAKKAERARAGDVDAHASAGPDPEEQAVVAERRAKLARYLKQLPEVERRVVEHMDFEGLTIDETAEKVGRPRATVARLHKKAWDALIELARKSTEETERGLRRRPPPRRPA